MSLVVAIFKTWIKENQVLNLLHIKAIQSLCSKDKEQTNLNQRQIISEAQFAGKHAKNVEPIGRYLDVRSIRTLLPEHVCKLFEHFIDHFFKTSLWFTGHWWENSRILRWIQKDFNPRVYNVLLVVEKKKSVTEFHLSLSKIQERKEIPEETEPPRGDLSNMTVPTCTAKRKGEQCNATRAAVAGELTCEAWQWHLLSWLGRGRRLEKNDEPTLWFHRTQKKSDQIHDPAQIAFHWKANRKRNKEQ